MTDLIEQSDVQDERSQLDAVEDLKIADLRKVAKILGISAQRDWNAEDFVRAIKQKQTQAANGAMGASIVFDNSLAPAPGLARIIIHRDMTPGHKNTPIHAGINGRLFQIPRGVEVDVPIPLLEVLQNARSIVLVQDQDGTGQQKESMVQSYPFQILGMTPGKFVNQIDGRAASYERRKAFHNKFGRWPTEGELKEAMKQQIARLD